MYLCFEETDVNVRFSFLLSLRNARINLEQDEQILLESIFGTSNEKALSELVQPSAGYEKFKDAVMGRLIELKYFTISPKYVKTIIDRLILKAIISKASSNWSCLLGSRPSSSFAYSNFTSRFNYFLAIMLYRSHHNWSDSTFC